MLVKSLLKLSILALFLAPAVHAETNLAGEEIVPLEDLPAGPETLQLGTTSEPLTLENYTQDTSPAEDAAKQADLWQRIKSGYAMPEIDSPMTAAHESWYASRPDYVSA
jgi:membrane-bound lytic murein transglycosylase D